MNQKSALNEQTLRSIIDEIRVEAARLTDDRAVRDAIEAGCMDAPAVSGMLKRLRDIVESKVSSTADLASR